MYFFKFWSKQGEYERENSLGWSKKCHDKKSPLKFAIFELQKWYIPKNKCQLTLQKLECSPLKKSCVRPCSALWKNVLSKDRNSHGCKAVICKIPCIDCNSVKLSFFRILAIHARKFPKKTALH